MINQTIAISSFDYQGSHIQYESEAWWCKQKDYVISNKSQPDNQQINN